MLSGHQWSVRSAIEKPASRRAEPGGGGLHCPRLARATSRSSSLGPTLPNRLNWAALNKMSRTLSPDFYRWLCIAGFATFVLHEAGHWLAGTVLGYPMEAR